MTPPWHPERLAARRPFLRRRAVLKRDIEAFLASRGYVEVETPVLQRCPGMEPNLLPFHTRYMAKLGVEERLLALQFSPEFSMKKLLAGGAGPIFQFAKVFRNGEVGPQHQPEFTMLEWYCPSLDFHGLMDETEMLLKTVCPNGLSYGNIAVSIEPPFERMTVSDAFQKFLNVDLLSTIGDQNALCSLANTKLRDGETWQDVFFRLLLDRIEPSIGFAVPTFLTHWPASEAGLSKRDPADPRVALRFELFVAGMELANAYEELTDPSEQRERFSVWRDECRAATGEDRIPDEEFLAALDFGLPPCAGIALGFDRLAMLASGARTINDVLWLPAI